MSGSLHNVDICVTCICDKPPQLPLREELPSLGIEVVYNGKGVGAEGVQKEFNKEKERIHQKKMKEKMKQDKKNEKAKSGKKSFLSPPGKSLLPKFGKKEDPPEDFAIPKALSYGSYQRSLDIRTKNETESLGSSIETTSSLDEKDNRKRRKKKLTKRLKGLFKKSDPNAPPNSVEFPNIQSLEEAALQEAFNAFMSDDDADVPKKPSKIAGKNDLFPDLLPGSKNNPEQLEKDDEPEKEGNQTDALDYSSSEVEQTTVSSLGNDSSIFKKDLVYAAEDFGRQAIKRLNKLAVDNGTDQAKAKKSIGGRGNIKVKLMGNGADNHITELYDLTEISEDGNSNILADNDARLLSPSQEDFPDILPDERDEVVCHGSTAPTSPYATNFDDQHSEESSVPVPRIHDAFGKSVLDVSNVYEENGPGSPLMLSPVAKRDPPSFALSPSSFAVPDNGQAKKKANPYLPSFFSNPLSKDEFVPDGRDDIVVYRAEAEDMSASFRERNLSPVKLEIASPYRSSGFYSSSGDRSLELKVKSFDQAIEDYKSARTTKRSFHSRLAPSIRKSFSRDSYDSAPKVSFSEDIEERRYFKQEKYDYDQSMADVKSSLSAIVNEGRDFTEPLPSALSREADEAFQAFTDQLGVLEKPRTPQQMLLEALSYGDPLPFDFDDTIKRNPSIASEKLPDVDTYALHSACLRAFPKRFGKDQTCRVKDLVHDLKLQRKLVEVLVAVDPETCRRVDANGDLPVHIMARKLMEWEGQWYQKVYDKSKGQDVDDDSGSGITTLYQSMSECINVLLQPVIEDDSLCLQSGSVGRLLPLHIAAIFTVQYDTLKSLLEAFPNAASIKCDLNDIKTFVPNHCTPLELHDKLSTDFPKWEIQRVDYNPDEALTQDMLDAIYGTTNGIRRSDLMFAYSPNLLPYRKEDYRIRRMEKMIQTEMQDEDKYDKFVLSRSAEVFWVWLCEFQGEGDASDNYAESVKRIVDSLPFRSVRFLASVLNGGGHPVIERATPSCTNAIMERLDTISKTEIPVRLEMVSSSASMRSSLLNKFEEETSNRLRLYGQGFVGPLCRTIFNITETKYPTSFVLLPYKLVKDAEGRLGLESSQAAKVAMNFAEFLSDLTTPINIIDILDDKVNQTLGENLVDELNRAPRESRQKHFNEFLKLYENEPAYFYFIDDCTGVPIVDETDGIYPMMIADAAETVEKVFPMMLSGMILMRGEKAMSILADVLLNENIKFVMPNWIEAAKDLIGFTLAPNGDSTKLPLEGLLPLRPNLIKMVQYGPTETDVFEQFQSSSLPNEWVVEMSLVKMLIEMHDPRHFYCDLLQERATTQVLWTRESGVVNDGPNQIDFESPKSLEGILNVSHFPETFMDNDMTDDDRAYEEHFEKLGGNSGDAKNYARNSSGSEYSSGEYTNSTSEDEMPGMVITTNKMNNPVTIESDASDHARDSDSYLHKEQETQSSASSHNGSSAASYNVDNVVDLRVQLEEDEEKLKSLRSRISYLDKAGDELVERDEKINSMIDEIATQKDVLEEPSKNGLAKAKALLNRICELEDRVLCREVEVGQLKNDVSCLQLEASEASNSTQSRRVNEALSFVEKAAHSTSNHTVSLSSSNNSNGVRARSISDMVHSQSDHEQAQGSSSNHDVSLPSSTNSYGVLVPSDYPVARSVDGSASLRDAERTTPARDEDIQSMESETVLNLNQVPGLNDTDAEADESTVGNSTMYDSSIEGYSVGYSAGMLRHR